MTLSIAEQVALALDEIPEDYRIEALAEMLGETDLEQLQREWSFWARPEQQAPPGLVWIVWAILAGRGFGKTRTGAEWILDRAIEFDLKRRRRRDRHLVALVGRTAADCRDVMVEGNAGLIACCERRGLKYRYEPSKRRFAVASLGMRATTFSAEEPNSLRGPEHLTAWGDEVAAWQHLIDRDGNTAWNNLLFGLRIDGPADMGPRVVATTTPRPIDLIKEWDAADREGNNPDIVVTRGSFFDNQANLAEVAARFLLARFEGSVLALQELYGLVLDVVEGALWTPDKIAFGRVSAHPELSEVVVAVDPPAGFGAECGIIVVGIAGGHAQGRRHCYVLEDASMHRAEPEQWGEQVVATARKWGAYVVAEVNNGGEMVRATVHNVDPTVRFESLRADKSKWARAEPVAALYGGVQRLDDQQQPVWTTNEEGLVVPEMIPALVHHVGYFGELESQQCSWREGEPWSPDRMDAVVWGVTHLMPSVARPPTTVFTAPTRLNTGASSVTRQTSRIRN